MSDEYRDLFRYSHYFSRSAPSLNLGSTALLAIGAITGVISVLLIHYQNLFANLTSLILYGASSGLLVVSLPAVLTMVMVKIMRRRLLLKHLMYLVLICSAIYSLFIMLGSAFFALSRNYTLTYVTLLVGNAGIYGFWLLIGRFLITQRSGRNIIPAIQPTLNILFYIPLGGYILNLNLPVAIALIKLYAGMLIFLIFGYAFLYLLDKPLKQELNVSGIKVFTLMVNQWLYSFSPESEEKFPFGVRKDIPVDLLLIKNKGGRYKAIFVKPDIHYGPFSGFGGGVATEYMGTFLSNRYKATTLVLHGPVNINHNPISNSQVYRLAKNTAAYIDSITSSQFRSARGNIYRGADGPCRAINMKINDCDLLTLTKAPLVTEDIDYDVGLHFKQIALKDAQNAIIIDAHNSRTESASEDELKGVYYGSKYTSMYENAIRETLHKNASRKIRFGSSQQKISNLLDNPKDLGKGYTSFCVFEFGRKRFGMLHFDANNILPKMREELIKYVKRKYHIETEVYTTDTHSVNNLALPSSNVIGRFTSLNRLLPIVDVMVRVALNNTEDAYVASGGFTLKGFRVWGENAEKEIERASRATLRRFKYVAPFVIAAGFTLAAWIIYLA